MRNRKRRIGRRVIAVLIAAGLLIFAVYAVRFAMRMREHLQNTAEYGTDESGAEEIEFISSDSGSEDTPVIVDREEVTRTEELLDSQTKAANQENAQILKGVIAAAVPDVSSYAAALRGNSPDGEQKLICLDPAHQASAIYETERIGPGLDDRSQKMTVGAVGTVSGKHEYEITLEIALKLREELIRRGYSIVMTRETNDASISEAERARTAYLTGSDILVHISCGSSEDTSIAGVEVWEPTYMSPSLGNDLVSLSQRLAGLLLESVTASTGQNSLGLMNGDELSSFNWSEVPVTTVQVGYLSNPDEEAFISGYAGQSKIVTGIADGIDAYFRALEED